MKTIITVLTLAILSSNAFSQDSSFKVENYVPGGKVSQVKEKEVKVLTPNSTIVEIEFKASGEFEEASGDASTRDIFVPGQGLLSLSDAVASLAKAGKKADGEWSLEHSFLKGWVYEFNGIEGVKKMEYFVDAKTGKLLESRVDD